MTTINRTKELHGSSQATVEKSLISLEMRPFVEKLQKDLLDWLSATPEPGEIREDLYEIALAVQKYSKNKCLSRSRIYAFISGYFSRYPDEIKFGKCLWAGSNTVYRLGEWVESQGQGLDVDFRPPSWGVIDKIFVLFGYQPLLPRIRLGIWQKGDDINFGNMSYIRECIKYPEERKRGENAVYWNGFCLCSAMLIKIEVGLDLAIRLDIPIFAPLEASQLDEAGEYRCFNKGTGNAFGVEYVNQYPLKKEHAVKKN